MPPCPGCRQPLVILEYQCVEVDHCLSCGGTWLDAGELERIAEMAGADPAETARALAHAPARLRRSGRQCPRCGKALAGIAAGKDNATELDRCPRGHGMWFDRGEIEAVIGALGGGAAAPVTRFFADLYRREHSSEKKGE